MKKSLFNIPKIHNLQFDSKLFINFINYSIIKLYNSIINYKFA